MLLSRPLSTTLMLPAPFPPLPLPTFAAPCLVWLDRNKIQASSASSTAFHGHVVFRSMMVFLMMKLVSHMTCLCYGC
ncbi:hypothetical protein BDZ94DRAFT_891326 [Collybia nuda]|uniref:Uncharacterized protein n=1 Tax=Collybia nuda TaxID=64659 RepID=A0A9P5XSZ7_9AGAR|nr:hypothetical protein BDZ94DRAFT_891326 [Collybia nuda]